MLEGRKIDSAMVASLLVEASLPETASPQNRHEHELPDQSSNYLHKRCCLIRCLERLSYAQEEAR